MSYAYRRLASICALLALASTTAFAADLTGAAPADDLLNPHPGQFELNVENLSGFIGSGSIVRVREFRLEGTGLHFPALGINTVQMPDLDLTYWFNELNAINAQFRYFDVAGSHTFSQPIKFNGAVIAGNQKLNTDPDPEWFAFYIYYVRRLTPLYEQYESTWPESLQGWDLRGRIGLEYTYINFAINGGKAKVISSSPGEETKEDFYHQSMPLLTIGLEALRNLGEHFTFDTSVKGNWINRWNSLRNEGGTIWASQNGVEVHFRLLFSHPWLGRIHPMVGFALYYYSQLEDSSEDGNFIRWFTYGPEYGVKFTF
jgi:hypothetical protein